MPLQHAKVKEIVKRMEAVSVIPIIIKLIVQVRIRQSSLGDKT